VTANQVLFNVLGTHDTARIKTVADENSAAVKMVMAFLYLQSGTPCLYYGDEYGMSGDADPDCRKCMVWYVSQQDLDMYEFVKSLIAFRHEFQKVIVFGKLQWKIIDEEKNWFSFSKEAGNRKFEIFFNRGAQVWKIAKDSVQLGNNLRQAGEHIILEPFGFAII